MLLCSKINKSLIINSVFYAYADPKKFFTTGEKALWRNCAKWNDEDENPEWITLPGPADWWPENIDDTGFYFSDVKSGHFEAYKMIHEKDMPDEYEMIFPSENELVLMEKSSITEMTLKAFLNL